MKVFSSDHKGVNDLSTTMLPSKKSYITDVSQTSQRDRALKARKWQPMQKLLLQDFFNQFMEAEACRKKLKASMAVEVLEDPELLKLMRLMGVATHDRFTELKEVSQRIKTKITKLARQVAVLTIKGMGYPFKTDFIEHKINYILKITGKPHAWLLRLNWGRTKMECLK
ncbi:MAG: hypothetical protein AAGA18_14710 [Verrucomicrobiota bacterium]